jgi:ADP-ribose pyrophosphatase YjhB (NUDIX family)
MILEKVTAFITRRTTAGVELLLFRHPFAGIQIPAGTVEEGETAEAAARREAREETGLGDLTLIQSLGHVDEEEPGHIYIARRTPVYARPDVGSFAWAEFRRGIAVKPLRRAAGFTQVSYEEWDRIPDGAYITYCITGWTPDDALSPSRRRHFFHFEAPAAGPSVWTQAADNHTFELFWTPLATLPPIIAPQQGWLDHAIHRLGYRFEAHAL